MSFISTAKRIKDKGGKIATPISYGGSTSAPSSSGQVLAGRSNSGVYDPNANNISGSQQGQATVEASTGLKLSGDQSIRSGQLQGIQRGEALYGQTMGETGGQVSDIIARRKASLEGTGPGASRIREGRNQLKRLARARGASSAEMAQIDRDAQSDIGRTEYGREQQALDKYQKLIGNVLGGQASLEQGFAGLQNASRPISGGVGGMGGSGLGGFFGTVICTELHKQGYMSKEIYEKDFAYGITVRRERPYVYIGYRLFADPLVKLMKKSKIITKLVSIPAMAWARNMAGDKNLFGAVVSYVGEGACGLIGKMVYDLREIENAS